MSDEIAKLKYKEPQSTKIVQLEQELVRAEAQSLVAEAQLTNIVSPGSGKRLRLVLIALDSPKVQGSLRYQLRRHNRACREADHFGQAGPPHPEPPR